MGFPAVEIQKTREAADIVSAERLQIRPKFAPARHDVQPPDQILLQGPEIGDDQDDLSGAVKRLPASERIPCRIPIHGGREEEGQARNGLALDQQGE